MPRESRFAILLGLAILAVVFYWREVRPPAEDSPPTPAVLIAPEARAPKGKPRRRVSSMGAWVGGPVNKDGTEIDTDLPDDLHCQNKVGTDRAGLCVFTSIGHSARYQNVSLLWDFRDWMTRYPGGGYPEKVDAMIQKIAKEKGVPVPEYVQVETPDLEILKAACEGGRMPAITYSVSPTGRYGGKRIAHMVSLVAAGAGKGPDGKGWYVVLDNNFPDSYEWMSEADFRRTYTGWAVILLSPGPPPPPRN